MIAIVDYGMGNLRSLRNAFEFLGHAVTVTSSADELDLADRIVLPGVGAFGDAMDCICSSGLDRVLTRLALTTERPILGICLGMQLFAKSSAEHGEHRGLGWIDAEVHRLEVAPPLKVPHVGWDDVAFSEGDWLFEGIRPREANFYFVHSFRMICHDAADVVATVDYGGPVTAAIRRRNLVATQFHPEKSQDNGLRLLENWVAWNP